MVEQIWLWERAGTRMEMRPVGRVEGSLVLYPEAVTSPSRTDMHLYRNRSSFKVRETISLLPSLCPFIPLNFLRYLIMILLIDRDRQVATFLEIAYIAVDVNLETIN